MEVNPLTIVKTRVNAIPWFIRKKGSCYECYATMFARNPDAAKCVTLCKKSRFAYIESFVHSPNSFFMTRSELVLVLDFGAQYAQLIARRVRELGVYSELYPFDIPLEKIRALRPKGIILSGSPHSV